MVYLYSMEGTTDYIFYYQKGKMANALAHDTLEEGKIAPLPQFLTDGGMAKGNLMAARGGTPVSTTWESPNGGGGSGGTCRGCSPVSSSGTTMSWMVVTTHSYTDFYNVRPNGVLQPNGTKYNGSTSEYTWIGSNAPTQYQSFNYGIQPISGAGAPVGAPTYTTAPPPPSCKSFDFKRVTSSSDWQAAAVEDFQMGVGVSIKNNFQVYRIKFPLLTFETWSKDRFGNVLSTGAAAELAAKATDETARATVKHFKDKWDFTEYDVKKWFEDELKRKFRSLTDGGSVTRGNPYNLTPKKFITGKINGCD